MITLRTSIDVPFILKTKYYGPIVSEEFGTFWDTFALSMLMIGQELTSYTTSSFILKSSKDGLTIKQTPSLTLKAANNIFVIKLG